LLPLLLAGQAMSYILDETTPLGEELGRDYRAALQAAKGSGS